MAEHHLKKLNRIKYILLIITVVLLAVVYWFLTRSFVSIKVAPKNAKVFIDNASVFVSWSGQASQTVKPGTHIIRIEADGYIGQSQEYEFKKARINKLSYILKGRPAFIEVEKGGSFLNAGKGSDDILFLAADKTRFYRAKFTLSSENEISFSKEAITDPRLSGINEIIWSPDKELALFKKNDGVYLFDFYKYDFIHQTETLWGKDIGSVAWSPDNSKIAYYNTADHTLVFSNILNTEKTVIANLAEMEIENPRLEWSPDSEWLLLTPQSQEYDKNKIYLFRAYSRTFNTLTESGDQIGATFSPDSQKITYTTYSKDANNPIPYTLSMMNLDGMEKINLDIRADLKTIVWKSDLKNIILPQYNSDQKSYSLVNYNLKSKKETGSYLNDFSDSKLNSMTLLDNDKILIMENAEAIYAINLN